MAAESRGLTMARPAVVDDARLRRFARLSAGFLRGTAAQGTGPRAARNRPGPGLEFLDLRKYVPGDDVRHIDWRQTSRRRAPMVRRYRDEAASDWLLCVDGSASMGLGGKWRLASELTIALAYALIFGGHRVALAIFAERIQGYCRLGRGQRQFGALLKTLLDYQPPSRGGASLPGLCADLVSRSGNLILISDFMNEDAMSDDLQRLRGAVSTARALQVLSADEATVPGQGTVKLIDVESGAERRLTLSQESRAAAQETLEDHVARVQRVTTALDVPFSRCVVGDDWEQVLVRHLGV